jgi:enoyl-CoA hydratase/carnithine racemase
LDLSGPIAHVTLTRPAQRNPLTPELCKDLLDAVHWIEETRSVRCAIISGEQGVFAAGADVRAIAANSPAENLAYNKLIVEAIAAVESLSVPTIAAIDGPALGGGLELALACTLRVASTAARLGFPEVRLGILPGAGGTERLPRVIGVGPALRMLLTGRPVGAEEALALGLVQEVAEPAAVMEMAERHAHDIATAAPLAVAAIKRAVAGGIDEKLERAHAISEQELARLLETSDSREGLAALLERRAPAFEGR